jgi:hypothetical protein
MWFKSWEWDNQIETNYKVQSTTNQILKKKQKAIIHNE